MWPKEIQPIDFASRRKQFLNKIKGSVAVFPSAPDVIRNNDVHHPYRQDSNFYYLTGFDESHSICMLAPSTKTPFQMFVQPKDKTKELWEGKIVGPEGVKTHYGADAAFPSNQESYFEEAFVAAMLEADALYYRVGIDPNFDQKIFQLLRKTAKCRGRTGRPFPPILDPEEFLGEMRLVKTKAEIERLANAARITAEAHVNAMRITKPGMYEYEVEAILFHAFRVHGASRLGYGSIVASGPNACVLHYVSNSRKMGANDLLLVDAGAEYDYYTADITRVFPVGGRFTPEQREIYGAVLKANKEVIRAARPGKSMRELHLIAVEVLTEEMKRLKILKGSTKSIMDKKDYFAFYPHNTGHWLGMDVHDVGKYFNENLTSPRKLQAGMVFTVEPGLYFGNESTAPSKYKGIGVRIEDDILITSDGAKVLTSGVPKEMDEVESMCSSA